METHRGRALKRGAFSLKLQNYDCNDSDDESSSPSSKRSKTYRDDSDDESTSPSPKRSKTFLEANSSEEDCDKITVIVKGIVQKVEIEIHPDAFVRTLRREVTKNFRIPFEKVSLYFKGHLLEHDRYILSDYNIKDGSKVYLMKNSNQEENSSRSTPLRSRKLNYRATQQNSEPVYVVTTPKNLVQSAGSSKNCAFIEDLDQVEGNDGESSSSFVYSTNVAGFVKSMSASGKTPDEINIALFQKIFNSLDILQNKTDKVEQMVTQVLEVLKRQADGGNSNEGSAFHNKMVLLPPHINLPLNTEEELIYFEQMLSTDHDLSSNLVNYLHQSSNGKSPSCFILNITRLVLSPELASGYSRFGRKGKKSFLPYKCTTDIILGAALKKYPDQDRDSLSEKFGKAMANAPEWNGRKSRMQVISASDLMISELTEISN